MKKMLVLLSVLVSFGLAACAQTPPSADKSSTNKDPALWQQYKSQKGIDELDANTK